MLYCSCCGSGMYGTYSVAHGRRYRYYACYRPSRSWMDCVAPKQWLRNRLRRRLSRAFGVSAFIPKCSQRTAFIARQRLAEGLTRLRDELAAANAQAKNLRSQRARSRKAAAARDELVEQIAEADARAAELRAEIQRRETRQIDEKDLRKSMQSFDEVWKALNIDEQRALLGHLVEKVGYDGRPR